MSWTTVRAPGRPVRRDGVEYRLVREATPCNSDCGCDATLSVIWQGTDPAEWKGNASFDSWHYSTTGMWWEEREVRLD